MPFSPAVTSAVNEQYRARREAEQQRLQQARAQVFGELPALLALEEALRQNVAALTRAVALGQADEQTLSHIRQNGIALRRKREALLRSHSYPADLLDTHYACPACRDTGYIGSEPCACYRQALREQAFTTSPLSRLFGDLSFDSFDLTYYEGTEEDESSPRALATLALQDATSFCSDFPAQSGLLLRGPAGVGKTHLSGCIARALLDEGHTVCYQPACDVLRRMEQVNFDHEPEAHRAELYHCDLLIIDDLGSEFLSPFCCTAFYHLINSRLLSGRPTICTTNCTLSELESRYGARTFSRLVGEFTVLELEGADVRLLKKHQVAHEGGTR